jgi:hypothetical protein
MKKKVIKLTESDIENLVNKIIKEEYDNHMQQPSIIGDIESDLMEMSNQESLEYLEDIIQYCMDKKQELGSESTEEESGEHTQEEMNDVWRKLNEWNSESVFERMEKTFNEESMSVEQFVDYLPTHFGYDEDYLISVLKQIKEEGI